MPLRLLYPLLYIYTPAAVQFRGSRVRESLFIIRREVERDSYVGSIKTREDKACGRILPRLSYMTIRKGTGGDDDVQMEDLTR